MHSHLDQYVHSRSELSPARLNNYKVTIWSGEVDYLEV